MEEEEGQQPEVPTAADGEIDASQAQCSQRNLQDAAPVAFRVERRPRRKGNSITVMMDRIDGGVVERFGL